MHAPQIIVLCLMAANVGIDCAKNGEPNTGRHNGTSSLFAALLTFILLDWGGFFSL
jgi:hypothetical protein